MVQQIPRRKLIADGNAPSAADFIDLDFHDAAAAQLDVHRQIKRRAISVRFRLTKEKEDRQFFAEV
jgi:hypothetical protein